MKTKSVFLFSLIFLLCNTTSIFAVTADYHHEKELWASFPNAPVVLASPHLGIRSAYDGSDLITNFPAIDEDLAVLRERQKQEAFLKSKGETWPDYPLIELSGYVEGQIYSYENYNAPTDNNIDLSGATLDTLAEISPWITGHIRIEYDNSPPITGARYTNSNFFLDRGLIIIGNLNKSPFFSTLGQINMPFGKFDSYLATDPLTKTLAKVKNRALKVSFAKSGFHGSLYTLRGDSFTGDHPNINNWGANLVYDYEYQKFDTYLGVSYIGNIADSEGMQSNGFPSNSKQFQGFGQNRTTNNLKRKVPAGDIRAHLGYGPVSFISEYVAALRSFNPQDLSFNSKGAKVNALDLELAYKFNIVSKPCVLAADYGQSWESLALNIPQHSYAAVASISLWKNTIEQLEYRHDTNYSSNNVANGAGGQTAIQPQGSRGRNLVTAQIDVYF